MYKVLYFIIAFFQIFLSSKAPYLFTPDNLDDLKSQRIKFKD